MEENYCPVCGEETPAETTSNATNTGRFVKEPEFAKVFPCFLRVFEVKDPPWFEKAFVFCSECNRQLTVVSELEEVMKEVERRLKESEKVVQDKLKSSESKFQWSGVYRRDQRYWKVREQYLKKNNASQGYVPERGSSAVSALFTSQEKRAEYVSCEVDRSLVEDFLDESEVADAQHPHSGVQPENPVPRPRRNRAPPKRFNPDEVYTSKKKKTNEASIETGRRITSIPKDVHQTIKVEEGEEEELYQILDEMVCPNAPKNVSVPSSQSQSSSMAFTTDPLAFAQQLDGGVVEYIKVEVNVEDQELTLPQTPNVTTLPRILRKPTPKARTCDFNFATGVFNSQREYTNLSSSGEAKTHVRKEQPAPHRNGVYDERSEDRIEEHNGDVSNPPTPDWCRRGDISTLRYKILNGSGNTCSKSNANTTSLPAGKDHAIRAHRCVLCHSGFKAHQELATHIVEVHESQENYDKLLNEKAKEAELRWLTPGKPVVTHFGIPI